MDPPKPDGHQAELINRLTERINELSLQVTKKASKSSISKKSGRSKKQIIWLEWKAKLEGTGVQHADSPGGEKLLDLGGGRLSKVDGFIEETGVVREFHGDHWHGNPRNKDQDMYVSQLGKTYRELYQETLEKDRKIKEKYYLETVWEDEFDAMGISLDFIQRMPTKVLSPPESWFVTLTLHKAPTSPNISMVGLFSLKNGNFVTSETISKLHNYLFKYQQEPLEHLIEVLNNYLGCEVKTTNREAIETQLHSYWEEYLYKPGRYPNTYGFELPEITYIPGLNPITGKFQIYHQKQIPLENLRVLTLNPKLKSSTVMILTGILRDKLYCHIGVCLKADLVEKFLEYKSFYLDKVGVHPIPFVCKRKK